MMGRYEYELNISLVRSISDFKYFCFQLFVLHFSFVSMTNNIRFWDIIWIFFTRLPIRIFL